MTIRVALNHHTSYHYDRLTEMQPQVVRLRPAPHCRTPILSYSLMIQPADHFINWQQDPHGNHLARLVFPKPTRMFQVEVDLVSDMTVINPFDFFIDDTAADFPFEYAPGLAKELRPFLETVEVGDRFFTYLSEIQQAINSQQSLSTVDFLVELNQRLQRDIGYRTRMEAGVQSPEQTLKLGTGSCRDSSWLLVQLLRRLGLAARFVSGYLIQLTPDQKPLDGPEGPDSDFSDLHAWAEAFLPGAGWVGLDPTSGLLAGEGHIPLAATPEPSSAAPITGTTSPAEVQFEFSMSVRRIHEDSRVTKPYSPEQWRRIESLAAQVDQRLSDLDVRLTMGGEPTFVSIDDMDGEEWTTSAVGTHKRALSERLLKCLRERFAPGGLLHYGQGKRYPGESLPRWALGCYWRKDGEPVWNDPYLIADTDQPSDLNHEDARIFVTTLARYLELPAEYIAPAFEDVAYFLVREQRLPIHVELRGTTSSSPGQQVAPQQLDAPPVPHSSDVGMAPRRNRLPPRLQIPGPAMDEGHPIGSASVESVESGHVVRTALCVEVRDGRLHVFMPPVERIEDYLDLLAAIEATAATLKVAIVIEGYPPPQDSRINVLKVTPESGVIEVNTHPAANWNELVNITRTLYEEARQTRLGTEKFDLDGKHNGTGGGNHVVLGGATPADSPFLRRPGLLKSLLGYWINHPSLSYLFSGRFIGPTGQAPRVDEGRRDALYELAIAFSLVPAKGEDCPGWLIDRIFRNLLVDLTGNTDRAEFCIDKLFSPDSSTGRLGLVELRGFEMPPHAEMSLTQQLLIRSLVAAFWDSPYEEPIVEWGTSLHDRFMLPHFVWDDFCYVLSDLQRRGIDLSPEWFLPHFEFRFPKIGELAIDGVQVDIRTAIEPWYVLGEEPAGGGTVRFVDSSVERLEVKVRGAIDQRHVMTCNGRRLPLHPTRTVGEYVCGVRYRAWQPPSCLHPTIPVHTPLTFDMLDRWALRSLGGCTYHAAHPAGRNYETFPVNANEAEARRAARFFPMGHTPGAVTIPSRETNPAFPLTLDLRRNPTKFE